MKLREEAIKQMKRLEKKYGELGAIAVLKKIDDIYDEIADIIDEKIKEDLK